jgi:nitric oxide dioxygenase
MGVQATQVKGSGEAIVDTTQAAHPGWMSNLFHDTLQEGHEIEVAYPFGDFVLDAGSGPVVLIAAGVGATPLLAMLNAILSDAASMNRKVSWIQAAKTPLALPFRKIISDLAAKHGDRLRVSLHYTNPLGAPQGEVFTSGRIDAEQLDTRLLHLDDETAQYYTCGPDVFMRDMAKQLRSRGVDHRRIHAELFTSGELLV